MLVLLKDVSARLLFPIWTPGAAPVGLKPVPVMVKSAPTVTL
jgi:hypothetical protein